VLDTILSELTPEPVRDAIVQAARAQDLEWRGGVSVGAVARRLVGDRDLGDTASRGEAYLALMRAITEMVGQIEGMRIIDGGS